MARAIKSMVPDLRDRILSYKMERGENVKYSIIEQTIVCIEQKYKLAFFKFHGFYNLLMLCFFVHLA